MRIQPIEELNHERVPVDETMFIAYRNEILKNADKFRQDEKIRAARTYEKSLTACVG